MLLNRTYNIDAIAPPPSTSYRYWRMLAKENRSGGSTPAISADNILMRSSPGGANLATDPTKAISDSEFSGSFLNDYAFNGAGGGFWVSLNTGGTYGTHWIGYDFTTPVDIWEIVWSKRPDSFGQNESPTVILVQGSNDLSSWTTVWAFGTPSNWGTGAETRTFTRSAASGKPFWRIRPTSVQGGSTYQFGAAEIEFRATAGGADQCSNGLPIGTTATNGASHPLYAFDNDYSLGSFYYLSQALVPAGNPWLGYAFTGPVNVNQVLYQLRGDSAGANNALTAGVIESSLDYTTWSTEYSITTPATWVNNSVEQRLFTR